MELNNQVFSHFHSEDAVCLSKLSFLFVWFGFGLELTILESLGAGIPAFPGALFSTRTASGRGIPEDFPCPLVGAHLKALLVYHSGHT